MIQKLALLAMIAIAPAAKARENPSSAKEAQNKEASGIREAAYIRERALIDEEILRRDSICKAFIRASTNGRVDVMNDLITLYNRDNLLNQNIINVAFRNAVINCHVEVLEYMLTPNGSILLPSPFLIKNAVIEFSANTVIALATRTHILNLLARHSPTESLCNSNIRPPRVNFREISNHVVVDGANHIMLNRQRWEIVGGAIGSYQDPSTKRRPAYNTIPDLEITATESTHEFIDGRWRIRAEYQARGECNAFVMKGHHSPRMSFNIPFTLIHYPQK